MKLGLDVFKRVNKNCLGILVDKMLAYFLKPGTVKNKLWSVLGIKKSSK